MMGKFKNLFNLGSYSKSYLIFILGIVILLSFINVKESLAGDWPVQDAAGNDTGKKSGIYGDYHYYGGGALFQLHEGLDIQASRTASKIICIRTGEISSSIGIIGPSFGLFVKVAGTNPPEYDLYLHLKNVNSLAPGQRVYGGITEMGEIENHPTIDHLHFSIFSTDNVFGPPISYPIANPLNSLITDTDTTKPKFDTTDGIKIVPDDGSSSGFVSKNTVAGAVDIVAHVHDPTGAKYDNGTDSDPGIWKISYRIWDEKQNNWAIDKKYLLNNAFTWQLPDNKYYNIIYDSTKSRYQPNKFYYIVTNEKGGFNKDGAWKTKVHKDDSSKDADFNKDALTPDGKYKVYVYAEDRAGNEEESYKFYENSTTSHEEVLIDNFRPYVKKVKITQGGKDVYEAEWVLDGTQLKLTPETPEDRNPEWINKESDVDITIDFSEAVKEVNVKIDTSEIDGSLDSEETQWTGTLSASVLESHTLDGEDKVLIIEAKDKWADGDVQLDSDPSSIAKRNATGGWTAYTAGSDENHTIKIDTKPPEITIEQSTFTVTIKGEDELSGMVNFTGTFGDGGEDDFDEEYDPPNKSDSRSHSYEKMCSERTYTVTAQAKDEAENEYELPSDSITIEPICGPPCFDCDDSSGKPQCRRTPSTDPRCQPRRRPRPDDNVDLSTPPPVEISSLSSYDPLSPVGILRNGYYVEMFKLLDTFGAKAALVEVTFDPSIVEQIKLLVVPTGGLYGLNNSEMFKASLTEYVNRGGLVLCLAQYYGQEFSTLPGEISGYGWIEDQSCFNQAFYIEKYHQFLSGQDVANGSSDAAVDGYFITYPSETQVYLRRTRNGQAGLIKYPYGNGQVIVTTIYTDWAYTNAQATMDGRHLVRDIISWAKDPQDLPEFKPDEIISDLPIQIIYYVDDTEGNLQTIAAEKVKLSIYYPDRNQYTEQILDIYIEPGEQQEIYLPTYTIPEQGVDTVGIWWIDYTLLDDSENILQEQMEGQRFVASPDDASPYEAADFYFSIQSDSDYYPTGGSAGFTFIVFNNTEQDEQITIYPNIPPWSESIIVPANSQNQIVRIIDPVRWIFGAWMGGGWVSARFFKATGEHLGNISKSFSVYIRRVNLNIQTDKEIYDKDDDNALINLTMTNTNTASYHCDAVFKILDPDRSVIFQQDYSIDFGPLEVKHESLNVPLPQNLGPGNYTALLEAFDDNGKKLTSSSKTFLLPRAILSVVPVFPSLFSLNNNVSFDLSNIGLAGLDEAALSASLKAPDGTIIWTGSSDIQDIAVEETKSVIHTVNISEIYLGDYLFEYEVAYEGKMITGQKILTSSLPHSLSMNKSIFKTNEPMSLTIYISNQGDFRQDFTLATTIPGIGFEDIRTMSMNPEEVQVINLTPIIEETTVSGSHTVQVEITLASGQNISKQLNFVVEELLPTLNIFFEYSYGQNNFMIRDDLVMGITLQNRGKFVDTLDVQYELTIPDIGRYTDTQTLTMIPDEELRIPYTIPIPDTLIEGEHEMDVYISFPNGLEKSEKFYFSIAESSLLLGMDYRTFSPLDTVDLWLENTGGVDANYNCALSLYDSYGIKIYEGTFSGNSLAGSRDILSFTVPVGAVHGNYVIAGECQNLKTGETLPCLESIEIIGNSATLATETDQEVYFSTDLKNILTTITNTSSFDIDDATLYLKIYSTSGCLPISGDESSVTPTPPPPITGQQGGGILDYIEADMNYSWEDEIGTGLNQGDDDYDLVNLGFTFPFYGQEYTQIYICSNGWLSFNGSNSLTAYSNPVFPTTNYRKVIAPLWDDWNPSCRGDVYYNTLSDPTRFVATWDVVPHYSCSGINTFQAILYEDGTIQFNYNEIQTPSGISIGLNEGDGVHYNYTNVYPTDSTSRIYTYQALSASVSPVLQFAQLVSGGTANFTGEASDPMGNPIVSYEWDFDDSDGIQVDATGETVSFTYSTEGKYIVTLVATNDQGASSQATAYVYVQGMPPAETTNPGSILTTTEQTINIGIISPEDGNIYCGESLPVEGFVNIGGIDVGNLNVVYVIDLSGSTGYTSACCYDINGDGSINALDDYNSDGQNGDILDAEIAGIIALNQSIGNPTGVKVGVVGFGQYAAPADVSPEPYEQLLAESPQVDLNNNGIPDIVDVVTSMDSGSSDGSIGLFSYKWVGEQTNFEAALTASYEILSSESNASSYVFFLSDGRPSYGWSAYTSQALDNLIAIDTIINTYGVTSGASPTYLRPMAERTGGTYTQVLNPTDLTAELGTVTPVGIERVAVNGVEVGLTPIGRFYTILPDFSFGTNTIQATAFTEDGTIVSANIVINMSQPADDESALVWETDIPINVEDSLSLTTPFDIGTLTGKFFLLGELVSSTAQRLGYDNDEFFVLDNEIQPSITTSKRIYKQGETVEITGGIVNTSALEAENLNVRILADGQEIYNVDFSLQVGENYPFDLTQPSDVTGNVELECILSQNAIELATIIHRYEVAVPVTSAQLSAPDVVGYDPFNVEIEINNTAEVESVIHLALINQSIGIIEGEEDVTISPKQTSTVSFSTQIDTDTSFMIELTGDHTENIPFDVTYGLAAEVSISPKTYYTEGTVEILYTITNTGLLYDYYGIEFSLYDQTGQLINNAGDLYFLSNISGNNTANGMVRFYLYEGTYTLQYNTVGDEGEITFQVVKPTGAITVTTSNLYPAGKVQIPYILENTGQVASEFELTFNLYKEGTSIAIFQTNVYLNSSEDDSLDPKYVGTSFSDNLQYELSAGDYTLEALIEYDLYESKSFQVVPREALEIEASLSDTVDGRIPVSISVSNEGFDAFSGSILMETDFWSQERSVGPISLEGQDTFDFLIDLFAGIPGTNELRIRVFNTSGNLLRTITSSFQVDGPQLFITQLPPYSQFPAGDTGTLTFSVKNDGDQEGYMELRLEAFEGGESQLAHLGLSEEQSFTFAFPIPEDLEERDYQASYSLKQISNGQENIVTQGLVTFHVTNVKVDVLASLDKKLYISGDTAHVILDIQNIGTLSNIPLIARVNFVDFEILESFTLPDTGAILEFDVPVVSFDGRLLYEVMMESGRSIYINSLYIHEKYDRIWLSTDKQTYLPGEEVEITVEASEEGTVTISALYGDFTQDIALAPNTPFTFYMVLPSDLIGGTQLINFDFKEESHVYPFDVKSYLAEFIEVRLNQSQYSCQDILQAEFHLLTNEDMDGYLDGFIEDPDGWLWYCFTYYGNFSKGVNSFSVDGEIDTDQTGMHKLSYFLYNDEARTQLLTTGSEAFDIGGFSLTQFITDKSQYIYGYENIVTTVYYYGEIDGSLNLYLDGQYILTEDIISSGFNHYEFTIPAEEITEPGSHTVKALLSADSLESFKEANFEVQVERINDLTARSKSGKVQLVWTHIGADSYNIYRRTEAEEYSLIDNTISIYSTYLDTNVTIGITYYYIIKSLRNGFETGLSDEVSVTPTDRVR